LLGEKQELERYLYDHLYRHPHLLLVRTQAQARLRDLFDRLRHDATLLPPKFQQRILSVGLDRAVGEYLAGMTDRFFNQLFVQLSEGRFRGCSDDGQSGYNEPSSEP
jgi:dGTPase